MCIRDSPSTPDVNRQLPAKARNGALRQKPSLGLPPVSYTHLTAVIYRNLTAEAQPEATETAAEV